MREMASRTKARLNNLNDRAREVGLSERLEQSDIDALKEFYGYTCLKCGFNPAISPDHVVPLSKGGSNSVDNLQLLCDSCNKSKGDDETDYRQGRILTREIVADLSKSQNEPPKDRRIKHDWLALRHEYETNETLSLRDLATRTGVFYTLLLKRSAAEGWVKSKEKFGINLVSSVNEEVKRLKVEKEINARGLLFDVIEQAVEEWQSKPSASLSDLVQLLKLGLVAQGEVTERTNVNVSERADDAEIYARINQVFDAGEEGGTYAPLDDVGDEQGAGWSD